MLVSFERCMFGAGYEGLMLEIIVEISRGQTAVGSDVPNPGTSRAESCARVFRTTSLEDWLERR